MQFVLCEMQFFVIRKVIGVEVELDGLLVKTYALHEVLVGTNYLGLSLEIHVCAQKHVKGVEERQEFLLNTCNENAGFEQSFWLLTMTQNPAGPRTRGAGMRPGVLIQAVDLGNQ